jgi:alpha-amylase/alpha-mannosidase (GH57 family)
MAEEPLDVAIFWHMHQPFYKSLRTGRMAMPWVRLHGTKDYLDMVLLAEEFPEIHLNVNWVPSLLDQLIEYASGEARDEFLDLSTTPPEDMDQAARVELLKTHFSAHESRMIAPFPPYKRLRGLRGNPKTDRGWRRVLSRFSVQDLRDLQVWLNLTWIDPLLRARDPFLAGLIEKGAGFSEDEKVELLEKQRAMLGEIIPATARAWKAGSLEVSTTPYYHPILPLLYDTNFARRARPEMPLPHRRFHRPEDAKAQIAEGVDRTETLLGRRPRGMWPSEGAVCDEILPLLRDAGIEWIATDEEVLAQSIGLGGFARDKHGNVKQGDRLYRAYRRSHKGASLSLVFRDHAASDLIGFQFANWAPEQAADAMIARLEEARRRLEGSTGPHIFSIILDGENCWEYFEEDGGPFLRAFYERLGAHDALRSVTISEHLAEAGEIKELPKLHSGSWINHDYSVWIGHPEDNTAWDLLAEARDVYETRLNEAPALELEAAARARQSLFIAEGSDWNWWYGDEHDSGNDEAFDALYREHLANVYRFLGLEPPQRLGFPILLPRRDAGAGLTLPRALVSPTLDGRPTSYFEWFNAGGFDPARAGGAMRQSGDSLLGRLLFGFDLERLYVRIDRAGRRRWTEEPPLRAAILVFAAQTWRIEVTGTGESTTSRLSAEDSNRGWRDAGPLGEAKAEIVLEAAVPFEALGLEPGDLFGIQVELTVPDGTVERQPPRAPISLTTPDVDFEARMWSV